MSKQLMSFCAKANELANGKKLRMFYDKAHGFAK